MYIAIVTILYKPNNMLVVFISDTILILFFEICKKYFKQSTFSSCGIEVATGTIKILQKFHGYNSTCISQSKCKSVPPTKKTSPQDK